MKMVASSAIPRPQEASRTYFHAASVASSVLSKATSRADTTVVTSIAIHSNASPLASGAQIIDQAKTFMPRWNRRLYRANAARSCGVVAALASAAR